MQVTSLAVLLIGNEILQVQVIEENYAHIAKAALQKGIMVSELRVVRDEKTAIANAVRELSMAYSYVISSGGIGPTHDDITLESIAAGFDEEVEKNEAMLQFLFSQNSSMNAAREKMTLLPRGSTLLQDNPDQWPVICFRNIFILPGLPPVLRAILPNIVTQLPQEARLYHGYIIVDQKEQDFAGTLDTLQKQFPTVSLGSYPSLEIRRVKISLTCINKKEALLCFQKLETYFGSSIEKRYAVTAMDNS